MEKRIYYDEFVYDWLCFGCVSCMLISLDKDTVIYIFCVGFERLLDAWCHEQKYFGRKPRWCTKNNQEDGDEKMREESSTSWKYQMACQCPVQFEEENNIQFQQWTFVGGILWYECVCLCGIFIYFIFNLNSSLFNPYHI